MNRNIITALVLGAFVTTGISGCAWWRDSEARAQTSGTVSGEPRGPVQTTADATITAEVKTKLAADELVKARNINVDTFRGVVQLNGTVNSKAEKDKAMSIARNVKGVTEVRDNLKIAGG